MFKSQKENVPGWAPWRQLQPAVVSVAAKSRAAKCSQLSHFPVALPWADSSCSAWKPHPSLEVAKPELTFQSFKRLYPSTEENDTARGLCCRIIRSSHNGAVPALWSGIHSPLLICFLIFPKPVLNRKSVEVDTSSQHQCQLSGGVSENFTTQSPISCTDVNSLVQCIHSFKKYVQSPESVLQTTADS